MLDTADKRLTIGFEPGDGKGLPGRTLVLVVAVAVAAQAVAWIVLIALFWVRSVGYGFHDLSDTYVYLTYAERMAAGSWPYAGFPFEYPPLAALLVRFPPLDGTVATYELWFSGLMIVFSLAAGALTAAAAAAWTQRERPAATAGLAYAVLVLAGGALVANRFDAAVALVIALVMLLLARERRTAAAAALGVGFALKFTPAILLPLILVLGRGRRGTVHALAAFAALAALPFLVVALHSTDGLSYPFRYHAARPLQIESVLTTPYLLGRLAGWHGLQVVGSYGSQNVEATGTRALATVSPWLALAALALVYALVWRRRALLRDTPTLVPGAGLAVVLAFVCTGKVLSPQFLIWTFPLVALSLAGGDRRQRWAAALCVVAIALTQVELPANYWALVAFSPGPVVLVAIRNFVLLAAAVIAAWALWRLPAQLAGADGEDGRIPDALSAKS